MNYADGIVVAISFCVNNCGINFMGDYSCSCFSAFAGLAVLPFARKLISYRYLRILILLPYSMDLRVLSNANSLMYLGPPYG